MAVSLAEEGTHVFNVTQAVDGYHRIRPVPTTQALLEDGRFVFNATSTSAATTAGRRLISPIGFRTDTVTVRY